jgi:5-formyltetrahydrofolate cyclo-ligase
METKRHIRKSVLKLRDDLPQNVRQTMSRRIIAKLMDTDAYKEAEAILSYVNFKSEVETEELIAEALKSGKRVYCPRIDEENMDFYRITRMEELAEGYKGIREPMPEGNRLLSGRDMSLQKCLMIMPGSVFDKERNRIGYGKGYYDRYLERYPQLPTIAICFECQMVEHVPAEVYDRKPAMILTEEALYT